MKKIISLVALACIMLLSLAAAVFADEAVTSFDREKIAEGGFPTDWGSNGILYTTGNQTTGWQVWVYNPTAKEKTLLATDALEACWSPEGNHIVFWAPYHRPSGGRVFCLNFLNIATGKRYRVNGYSQSYNSRPYWTPYGNVIYSASNSRGQSGLGSYIVSQNKVEMLVEMGYGEGYTDPTMSYDMWGVLHYYCGRTTVGLLKLSIGSGRESYQQRILKEFFGPQKSLTVWEGGYLFDSLGDIYNVKNDGRHAPDRWFKGHDPRLSPDHTQVVYADNTSTSNIWTTNIPAQNDD